MMAYAIDGNIGKKSAPVHFEAIAEGLCVGDTGKDPLLEPLVRSILPPDEANDVLRGVYTIAFHTKLMERLGHIRDATVAKVSSSNRTALQPWRLKRVTLFIDQNLDKALSLDCLAASAGLSRMHFAALFRKATGVRPHDYVVRRRIERAQKLLSESPTPIVDVALIVGFQSQSHFTTVFKRVLGVTPNRWRQMSQDADQAA